LNAQEKVYQAVEDRGYTEGWTANQFAARQIPKLLEELGELSQCFDLPVPCRKAEDVARELETLALEVRCITGNRRWEQGNPLNDELDRLAGIARDLFDDKTAWADAQLFLWGNDGYNWAKEAQKELADIQVVVFCLASALGQIEGKEFDVVQAAVEKSQTDIDRGTRCD